MPAPKPTQPRSTPRLWKRCLFRKGVPVRWSPALLLWLLCSRADCAEFKPAEQRFRQQVSVRFSEEQGLPRGPVQLIQIGKGGRVLVFTGGRWYALAGQRWELAISVKARDDEFAFIDESRGTAVVRVPGREVRQIIRNGLTTFVTTRGAIFQVKDGKTTTISGPNGRSINQLAYDSSEGLLVASSDGLFYWNGSEWERRSALDSTGRDWAASEILGVAFEPSGRLWMATKAGVGCRSEGNWRFYEGKDGLPWNDFTSVVAGGEGEVWLTTHLGIIHFDGKDWQYRQGPRWLPGDDVSSLAPDGKGGAWIATTAGLGRLERRPMTLAEKAEIYEGEIERFIKRTPYGFVAEAALGRVADKTSANPQDSDNDGLWTAMYGAGECFAYGATKDAKAKARAAQAFEALRFLQKVTQQCEHAPPRGYIARTIRPVEWADPNIGRLASDLEEQKHDIFWKAYEPRWPKSADGKWYWKSDTSSDELDGHYFFYPLYYDLCADTEAERERVRDVVREITDHLMEHQFCLVDHDGKPTRWGIYGPEFLNQNVYWWSERGLKSLSILCYLSVASHITGDQKYEQAARELIDHHGYAQNAMYPKVQHGPGSGNQSDDEMAFMCFYGLLRCSADENLKQMIRYSFYQYWVNEEPEMNPFFNFAYAGQNKDATANGQWGPIDIRPWPGWHEDAMATLYGFTLDRLNWPHRNSHRLDITALPRIRSGDLDEPDRPHQRGCRINGKVLPIENRHFNHWNTDPWQLDYGGNGGELAAGTVFLLPYYMGLYHGFIEKP
jgi:hypothetical protein